MGGGTYSSSDRLSRATSKGYYSKPRHEIFQEKSINNDMDPNGVVLRESRDSDEHPNSVPIIIALDLTGSMGSVPDHLVKDGLPSMVETIIKNGVADPQILFIGVGDHECDRDPLQVGQFESSDELLDKWLTTVYLEGGGGANNGESYLLAWYFAGKHTEHDAFDKRSKKGFLFTIGDEPTLKHLPKESIKDIMGDGQYSDETHNSLLEKAKEKYHVYHLHIKETGAGSIQTTIDDWKQLMGDHLIEIQSHKQISTIISSIISKYNDDLITIESEQEDTILGKTDVKKDDTEMML